MLWTEARQSGHGGLLSLLVSHLSTHCLWNECLQLASNRHSSPSLNSSKQIEHWRSSSSVLRLLLLLLLLLLIWYVKTIEVCGGSVCASRSTTLSLGLLQNLRKQKAAKRPNHASIKPKPNISASLGLSIIEGDDGGRGGRGITQSSPVEIRGKQGFDMMSVSV